LTVYILYQFAFIHSQMDDSSYIKLPNNLTQAAHGDERCVRNFSWKIL